MFFLLTIPFVYSNYTKKFVFKNTQSLLGPPVKLNGLNDNFLMKNDYLVLAQSSKGFSYTQLGYPLKNSTGSVISKEKTKNNLRLDFKIKYSIQERGNQQICFWFSNKSINKVSELKDGMCAVLTFNKSSVSLTGALGNNLLIRQLPKIKDLDIPKDDFILRIEKEKSKVKLSIGTVSNFVMQYEWKNDLLRDDFYFGLEVKQNEGIGSFLLTGIRTYDIVDIKTENEQSNRFGFFSWLLFIISAGGLAYYLYKNYSKYK